MKLKEDNILLGQKVVELTLELKKNIAEIDKLEQRVNSIVKNLEEYKINNYIKGELNES